MDEAARPARGHLALFTATAAVIVATALAGGAYSDLALASMTLVVWTALVVAALTGPPGLRWIPRPALAAAGLLLGLLALTALSLAWTGNDGAAFSEAVRLAGYLGVFMLAVLVARPERAEPILAGIAAGAVLVALIALGSRLLGLGDGDAVLSAALPASRGRLSYPIGYWNALGALVVLALPVLCRLAVRTRGDLGRGLLLACFSPPLLAAYMTSSRGALLTAALGLALVVGFSADRRAAAAAAIVGTAFAVPAVVAATLESGILGSYGSGEPGSSELVVTAALLGGMAPAAAIGGRATRRLAVSRGLGIRLRLRAAVAGLAAAAAVVIVIAGPSALIGDLRSGSDGVDGASRGIISASGSGRAQFWATAIDAFASEPARGIGAGAYGDYWNQYGSQSTPARNAHSEPLELLAELGPLGLAAFFGFFVLVFLAGARAVRARNEPAGVALAVVVTGSVGFLIDWTWQVPAVTIPVLLAGALVLTSASPPLPARQPLNPLLALALTVAIVVVAVPALWAGGVLALASSGLNASADAYALGRLDPAAAAARSAAAVEPWAAEPWLQLAQIELAGDNYEAARRAAAAAIARAPDDFSGWTLATLAQTRLGDPDVSASYALRSLALSPSG